MRHPYVPILALAAGVACSGSPQATAQPGEPGEAQRSPSPASTPNVVMAETVASGLERPWALEFLPDGRMLVTERPGRLRIVETNGTVSAPVTGVPAVQAVGQGGLLDVALSPDFATDPWVYLSFSEPGPGGASTAVARGRLSGNSLTDVQVIYSQVPKVGGTGHYGSRIVFANDGNLFVTHGDRQCCSDQSQDLDAGIGKVVRIAPDGSIPSDNPFTGRADARPEIWSLGHRNAQAGALHPTTGELWTVEHGARGGDELNNPKRGLNYGWPVITYGVDYSGASIGVGTTQEGMEQPVYYWDPVIAPSGMAFYTGTQIPGWQGSILIGSLSPGGLVRLEMTNGRVSREERYLRELNERFRDVKQGPDGFVYAVTDNVNGRVLRIRPVQ